MAWGGWPHWRSVWTQIRKQRLTTNCSISLFWGNATIRLLVKQYHETLLILISLIKSDCWIERVSKYEISFPSFLWRDFNITRWKQSNQQNHHRYKIQSSYTKYVIITLE
jgi:hypothetical protein